LYNGWKINFFFFEGDGQDYFVTGLLNGDFYIKLNSKGQTFEKSITIPGIQFYNNVWHTVKITRKAKKVGDFNVS
jgi:hypothetical protein